VAKGYWLLFVNVLVLTTAGLLTGPVSAQKPPAKPKYNILFVMTDQHNALAMSCAGNKDVKTPNLDRLARQGLRFTNAFTQTGQCCPARYTIWTGRYAHSHGCRWNGVLEPLEETTIVELLHDAGYVTGSFGKHHMINYPTKHGFDQVIDLRDYGRFITGFKIPNFKHHGQYLPGVIIDNSPVGMTHINNDQHPSGYWTNNVLRFLRKNKDKPFFIHYAFEGPHTPFISCKPWADLYDPKKITMPADFNYQSDSMPAVIKHLRKRLEHMTESDHRKTLACYYSLITQIDYNIGRVLDELEKLGLADRTIIVYTADHGEMASRRRCWTKPVSGYDATIRIPLIVKVPHKTPAGRTRDQLVGLIDLMPTLCELTGINIPEKVQGKSLVPLMLSKPKSWRKVIFSEVGYPGYSWGRCVTARTHTHKYVHHENIPANAPLEEFFDLQKDPWEMENQIDNPEYADIIDKLKNEIKRWESRTDHAPMYPIGEMKLEPRPSTNGRGPSADRGDRKED